MSEVVVNRPASRRILLIGWHGADWSMLDPSRSAGKMPHLSALIARGARGTTHAPEPLLDAPLWTTIATGKHPPRHRIVSDSQWSSELGTSRPSGTVDRRCKAFWNIFSQSGQAVQVVNWPATHPAEPILGAMISDRAILALSKVDDDGTAFAGVQPSSMIPDLDALRADALRLCPAGAQSLLAGLDATALGGRDRDAIVSTLQQILAETATAHVFATHLLQSQVSGCTAVCYPGLERVFRLVPDAPSILEKVLSFYDDMLGRLIELAGSDATLMLISDHGMTRPLKSSATRERDDGFERFRRGRGIVVVAGPTIRKGETLVGPSPVDVAPTLLAIAGLPIGADMDGRVWLEALSNAPDIDRYLSWESVPAAEGRPPVKPHDCAATAAQDACAHLRALGYEDPPDAAGTQEADAAIRHQRICLARSLLEIRRFAEVIDVLQPLYAADPRDGTLGRLLVEAYVRAGDATSARQALDELRVQKIEVPLEHLALAAIEFVERNPEGALLHLRTFEERQPVPGLQSMIGQAYLRLARWGDAERVFYEALNNDPDDERAHEGLAIAALARGQVERAAEHAMAGLTLRADKASVHFHLGVALAWSSQHQQAVIAFQRALSLEPDLAPAHRWLVFLYEGALLDRSLARRHRSRLAELQLQRKPALTYLFEGPPSLAPAASIG